MSKLVASNYQRQPDQTPCPVQRPGQVAGGYSEVPYRMASQVPSRTPNQQSCEVGPFQLPQPSNVHSRLTSPLKVDVSFGHLGLPDADLPISPVLGISSFEYPVCDTPSPEDYSRYLSAVHPVATPTIFPTPVGLFPLIGAPHWGLEQEPQSCRPQSAPPAQRPAAYHANNITSWCTSAPRVYPSSTSTSFACSGDVSASDGATPRLFSQPAPLDLCFNPSPPPVTRPSCRMPMWGGHFVHPVATSTPHPIPEDTQHSPTASQASQCSAESSSSEVAPAPKLPSMADFYRRELAKRLAERQQQLVFNQRPVEENTTPLSLAPPTNTSQHREHTRPRRQRSKALTYTREQRKVLAAAFNLEPYPTTEHKHLLAAQLQISFKHVQRWFLNTRRRWQRQKRSGTMMDNTIEEMPMTFGEGVGIRRNLFHNSQEQENSIEMDTPTQPSGYVTPEETWKLAACMEDTQMSD